jgi:hypothetical protein
MGRIATAAVLASEVINVLFSAKRQRTNGPRVHQAVRQCPLGAVGANAVATAIDCASPVPAAGDVVYGDFGKESSELLTVQVWDGEILGVSHDAAPSVSGLEPFGVSHHSGGSLYFTLQIA